MQSSAFISNSTLISDNLAKIGLELVDAQAAVINVYSANKLAYRLRPRGVNEFNSTTIS